ncbi:MAG: tRNA-dihydrouridine synthase family protein [Firmicutes bacterium]|nr:tRNA-dihydrouridine synthase family protein [Bacillota bacterium]MCL2771166.1 tRNA-dihydrouridine synthase family protein [Bacillota bacterium]
MLKIGNVQLKSNLILAPMAGYTDVGFRSLCKEFGAGLTVTEMVSVNAMFFAQSKKSTLRLIKTEPNDKPVSVQLFGNNPDRFREVLKQKEFDKFDIIDINCGCPARKITSNNEGGWLLKEFKETLEFEEKRIKKHLEEQNVDTKDEYEYKKGKRVLKKQPPSLTRKRRQSLAEQIIRTCVARGGGRPVTVKFRIGFGEKDDIAVPFARMCQQAGASAITLHARTVSQGYTGTADWSKIAEVKKAVSIPVIANGDITDMKSLQNIKRITNADGFMLGRATVGRPWIFSELCPVKGKDPEKFNFSWEERFKLINRYVSILKRQDAYIFNESKKQIFGMIGNIEDLKETKKKFMLAKDEFEGFAILRNAKPLAK